MSGAPTKIEVGDASFDVAAVGDWVGQNVWLFLLVAFVAFIFFIFQRGGFAEKYLEYRIKIRELDAKQVDDTRILADILRRNYDREDPYLPFDEPDLGDRQ